MDIFEIDGPVRLAGSINVDGSKNSALPILAAALLAPGISTVSNAPDLADIRSLETLLESLGAKVWRDGNGLHIDASVIDNPVGDYDIVRKMRASICILGPLLARCGRVKVSMPGGCAIGDRPVDIHLRGIKALGANVYLENGYIVAEAPAGGLIGTQIFLGGPFGSTVLGTDNVMMAAATAKGTTVIESAACEPEVADLANFLNAMGAKISGIGSPRLVIEGVKSLKPVTWSVIHDRIEAGTFMVAAAITRGQMKIQHCNLNHMMAVTDRLRHIGVNVESCDDGCEVSFDGPIHPADITTQPYPGFPTDLQAQFMALLALGEGNSVITEKIYPDRFMHVAELNRMAANLRKEGPSVIVAGVKKLIAAPVMASDLRASAALVLAGMAAEGMTTIQRVYHIDRGYHRIEEKLNAVGAKIRRKSI
ncbi:MAG TPA: UDP-N-acetylglucosamine 1-carboxyvinyltransferase [Anaerohalosphaeraceae bacterium]|nr:UDP-N-acetylglucosamine 1-carboxyvinyltransferase [Phycisphaerae bacterium]HOK95320.1 UDP-N-acetylglucosamine 1-carboxyvinyltransferase [Anaerohalosphaeraceae bacterium]HOL31492.1 UDP-N-acetylglucosamine 1-carboxyvinyltransferase [Anaerohalosphaeraceae bacterium]HOM76161.1 UDP-N-acetylglucosamine 1-carboxyvinyltransferase [Anaerohalosphaeraceae bacterium]HPC65049.1 UDP-N-acetylglucosamine 1-carboxyvinyltransferase [Anaerohalosphaeraceae bacterium]